MKVEERFRAGSRPPRSLRIGRVNTESAIACLEEEVGTLRRQVRRITERNLRAFDEGFAAAVKMVEVGADLHQLHGASGVVSVEWEDTQPVCFDAIDTDVDIVVPESV